MSIQRLPELIIAQIAAGEVIDSPAGVIKELVENSIDAGARRIDVLLRDLGMTHLQVRDDGRGISREDLPLALASFATSKIRNSDDLFQIHTMGFRGEALSSIRSVAKVTIDSIQEGGEHSWKINGEGDFISEPEPSSLPVGTKIDVDHLFYNVPIRKKFIGGEARLRQSILDLVTSYAIVHYNISFSCVIDDRVVMNWKGAGSLSERLSQIYSGAFMENMTPLYAATHGTKLDGYISGSGFYHSRPVFIKFFVNSRPVQYSPLLRILKKVYGELLPPGKFPAAYLFLEIEPELIDVNVHPQKKEIRFKDDNGISALLTETIVRSIENRGAINLNRKLMSAPMVRPSSYDTKTAEASQTFNFEPMLQVNESPKEVFRSGESASAAINPRIEIRPEIVHSRLFNTFILATSAEGVFLVDQHTAHERIQFEKYLEKINTGQTVQQNLLDPVVIDLSQGEKGTLFSRESEISALGFEIEDFGPAGIQILGVPSYLVKGEESEAIKILLRMILDDDIMNASSVFENMAKSLACRSALKKGESASLQDYSELLQQLYSCKNPLRCPHGRPTVIHLGRSEIFKLFNRPV